MDTPSRGPAGGAPVTRRGLSLIELVLALSLVGLAVAGLMGLARTTSRAALLTADRLDEQQGVRRALERVIEELRWAEAVVANPACLPNGLCPNRVRVRIPAGNPYRPAQAYEVVFQHNPRQREVERRLGRGVNNLASRVDSLAITYHDAQGGPAQVPSAVVRLRIALVARTRNGLPVFLESEVALRNRRVALATPAGTPVWRPSPRGPGEPTPPARVPPPGPAGPGEAR